jgi:hypothetical protein
LPFVVVGGSAVEQEVPGGTKAVDVLIRDRDWARLNSKLEHRKDAAPLEPYTGTIRGTTVAIGSDTVVLEFISPGPFGGKPFLEYVRAHGSRVYGGVRYARPSVVFYMRLALDDWMMYEPSVERDILAGVPVGVLDEAVRVGERFGAGPKIGERVDVVRARLRSVRTLRRE